MKEIGEEKPHPIKDSPSVDKATLVPLASEE
jgi:hypothetical protein